MFAIVVDSTSSTPPEILRAQGVLIVPLSISFGNDTYVEGETMNPVEFYARMSTELAAGNGLPKTSCPDPSSFESAFADALDDGADGVLCITLSAGLSGTNDFANIAARNISGNIEVIDSMSVAMETSFLIEKAIEMRNNGVSLEEAAAHLRKMAKATRTIFALDTMDNLIKGGRVGKAAGLAATALKLKPLLCVEKEDGQVTSVGKARGSKGALKKAVELTRDFIAENGDCIVRLEHGAAVERMGGLSILLDEAGIEHDDSDSGWIGAVIGTYAGAGAVAVALCPKSVI